MSHEPIHEPLWNRFHIQPNRKANDPFNLHRPHRGPPHHEKAARSEERKRKQRLRGIPDTLPPGEWRKFYERISAGPSDARRDEVRRRWVQQDPAGWAEYLRDLSNNWAGWRNWSWEEPTPPGRQQELTGDAAEVLGLSGDFGPA